MHTYSMTCACGDSMKVEAGNREEAVMKLKEMMTDDAIKAHMAEKHMGQPVPSMAEIHSQIGTNTKEEM